MGFGAVTDLSFLPLRVWNPPSTQEEKPKSIQEQNWRETCSPPSPVLLPRGLAPHC